MPKNNKTRVKQFIFSQQNLLLRKHGEQYELPNASLESSILNIPVVHQHALGTYADHDCYVSEIIMPESIPSDHVWLPLRAAFEYLPPSWINIAARAYQILNWDKNHHYCGRCGAETTKQQTIFEKQCLPCELTFYPKISPAVIVLVKKGKKILLARQSHFAPGIYALVAGFVEPGETLEQAVHREVYEETGISIKALRYFGSQSWPFPDSLMLAFTAEYAAGEITLIDGELEHAAWYDKDHLPGLPSSSISIAKKLIEHFLQGLL